ncbi:hypothetical protein N566_09410 [Streptomycetaceae bacterium MP113-05]|nr:hypothetical protein N566_09410 [Streptomycetaceae bacterium MP113-05]
MNASELQSAKSSYSSSGDGTEVALIWRKSSHSSGGDGDCVEVATCPGAVHVRDSKHPGGPQLALSPSAWRSFLLLTAQAG